MTARQSFAHWLALAAQARALGFKGLHRQCIRGARSLRYCPYHRAYDALPRLPG